MEIPFECIVIEPTDEEEIYLATSLNTSHVKCAIFHACGITNIHGKGSRKYKKEISDAIRLYSSLKYSIQYENIGLFVGLDSYDCGGMHVYLEDDAYSVEYKRMFSSLRNILVFNGEINSGFLKDIIFSQTWDGVIYDYPVKIIDNRKNKTE